MRVAIDQPRNHYSSPAVEIFDLFAIGPQPRIAQQFALRSSGKDLSAAAQHGRILYQGDFLQIASAPWRRIATQRKQLADVGQEQVGNRRVFGQAEILQLWHCKRNAVSQTSARSLSPVITVR
jgi:hypothetical protein